VQRPAIEVADVLRRHGDAFRRAKAGHLDRSQFRVMGAIETCRTAALGGHVARCGDCGHMAISYNSCVMGKASNRELAIAMTVFSCVLSLSRSPLQGARAPPSVWPLMAVDRLSAQMSPICGQVVTIYSSGGGNQRTLLGTHRWVQAA
jgi:hypothetical protein